MENPVPTSRCPHVMTSQSPHVTTSQHCDVEVRQRAYLYQPNVMTSRCRWGLISEILRYKAEATSFEKGSRIEGTKERRRRESRDCELAKQGLVQYFD